MEKSKGQTLVEKIAGWIGGYMALSDPSVAVVLALWAINTWVFERFDATPYLCVTASTKQAGKTRLMELLAMVCRNGRMFGSMTPAAMFRLMEAYDSKLTMFFDEAEALSGGAAGVMRQVMNTGYRAGQTVIRTLPGGKVGEFHVYGPKCFALIGDVYDTLRDRSIVVKLERGVPSRELDQTLAKLEAAAMVEEIRRAFVDGLPVVGTAGGRLKGRDKEIWSSLFGVAEALKLNKPMMETITRVAADLTIAKTAKARKYVDMGESEDDAIDSSYAEDAMRDLRAVLRDGEPGIFSAVAVQRMREIPEGPWRGFRGVGLDEGMLAKLVNRFGCQPSVVRMVAGKGASKAKQLNGYSRKTIVASEVK